jgi:hypothetical protein
MPWKLASDQAEYQRRYRAAHPDQAARQAREWRAANPERARAIAQRHEAKEERRAYRQDWAAGHREAICAIARRCYAAHAEARRAQARNTRASDPEEDRKRRERFKAAHPGYFNLYMARRRAHPFLWVPMLPWPTTCQVCGKQIDSALRTPDPLAPSLGHEPPIAWMREHPTYTGPLVLRPEHWTCNVGKGSHPDWELKERSCA